MLLLEKEDARCDTACADDRAGRAESDRVEPERADLADARADLAAQTHGLVGVAREQEHRAGFGSDDHHGGSRRVA